MSAFHNNVLIGSSSQGYRIERSLRFSSGDSSYLNRTPASAGSQTTWTWSAWIKRAALGATANRLFGTGDNNSAANQTSINLSSDSLDFYNVNGGYKATTAKFRDPSAWYHVVVVWDSNNATASDRMRLYVNGVRLTAFSSSTDPSIGTNTVVNSAVSHAIGTLPTNSGNYFDGYLTEINFIDGQALTPSSFGETDTITGVWKPKKYSGTYSGNSFYLKFADNSGTTSTTLGKDSSGLGNNFTPNNFSITAGAGNDSLIDTPTPYADGGNGRGNYCTLNPLDNPNTTYAFAQDGNLLANLGTGVGTFLSGTMHTLGGKYYWEFTPTTVGNGLALGITYGSTTTADANSKAIFYALSGGKRIFGTDSAYGASYTNGDVIGVAVNSIAGTIEFFKNNTSQGVITDSSIALQQFRPFVFNNSSSANSLTVCNFGQRSFSYTPPSGFLALNTQNLPEPTIKKPSAYMDVVTWTGNGSAQTISSLGFSPDFIWIKDRNTARSHYLANSIIGGNNYLSSDSTSQELTTTEGIKSITSNGFTLGYALLVNNTSETYAAWCWDESATPGFDIVTYTGNGASPRSINHSLGVAPSFVVVKNRTTAGYDWPCYHTSLGSGNVIWLQLTSASDLITNRAYGGVDSVSSTTFTVKSGSTSGGNVNANGDNYVAYLWSEVAGFSKFGSFTSNANSDGPYVHLGFRPKVLWIKKTTGSTNANTGWYIFDSVRGTYNVTGPNLRADLPDIESTFNALDFTSNGFKLRVVDIGVNSSVSGDSYIFCAWAESPAKYSLAR